MNVDIREKVGLRIKEIRESKGMTQKDLAHRSDLDRSYIAGIETGKRNVSILNIEKIAYSLHVTLKEFFKHEYFD